MYSIEYVIKVSERDIPALPKAMRQRIKAAIESRLALDPVHFGKPLRHTLKGHRRLRVGDYRVVYRIIEDQRCVLVVAIGHRKAIYEMINGR